MALEERSVEEIDAGDFEVELRVEFGFEGDVEVAAFAVKRERSAGLMAAFSVRELVAAVSRIRFPEVSREMPRIKSPEVSRESP